MSPSASSCEAWEKNGGQGRSTGRSCDVLPPSWLLLKSIQPPRFVGKKGHLNRAEPTRKATMEESERSIILDLAKRMLLTGASSNVVEEILLNLTQRIFGLGVGQLYTCLDLPKSISDDVAALLTVHTENWRQQLVFDGEGVGGVGRSCCC
mmetsp:Transcript_59047/g.129653  ORF Transcript_59047/g.129653 Transcript_59047/m.129653 type:complete len:151 (+) Transcript_59047:17-469(+)